jgi:hypothetical protein
LETTRDHGDRMVVRVVVLQVLYHQRDPDVHLKCKGVKKHILGQGSSGFVIISELDFLQQDALK